MVGILTGIGLFLLGIPLAIGLGVVAGVANLIPFFGPVIAAIPTALFAFTEGFRLGARRAGRAYPGPAELTPIS